MKKSVAFILLLIPFLFSTSCKKKNETVNPVQYRVICEELKPFSYVENGQLKGITSEIVGQVLAMQGIGSQTVEVTSDWQGALDALKTGNNVVLFTTDFTASRKDQMQWAGPVTLFVTGFMGLKSGQLSIKTIDEAKSLPSVAVVKGYSTVETLTALGFNNLAIYNTLAEAVKAVYENQAPVIFDIQAPVRAIAISSGYDPNQLDDVFNYATLQGYIAFSPTMSPELVALWQDQIDQLKINGQMQAIYDRYLPGEKAPGLVTIYTEENPPQNYLDSAGQLTGSSVEMLKAMMAVMGREDLVTMTTWTDAYPQVQIAPNSMIFSALRTPARENLFQWAGPVCKKSSCFFMRADNPVKISTIEEAKLLGKIGVPEGWATVSELTALGFTNIVTFTTPQQVLDNLMKNQVDAAVLNDISIDYMARELGYNPQDVRKDLLLSAGETYFAFGKDTRTAYIQQYQQAYTTIMNNGKFQEIWKKWYPGIDW